MLALLLDSKERGRWRAQLGLSILRGATLTLMAFMNLGYYEEATFWRDWLMRSIAGDPA